MVNHIYEQNFTPWYKLGINSNPDYSQNSGGCNLGTSTRHSDAQAFTCHYHKTFGDRAFACENSACSKFTGEKRVPASNCTTQPKQTYVATSLPEN